MTSMSMVEREIKTKSLVLTIPILLGVISSTAISVTAQSGFTEYDNKYFTMAYPTGWNVNDTKLGDLLYPCQSPCHLHDPNYMHHTVIFDSPNDNARIRLEIYGPVLHAFAATLDKNYWLDRLSYANVISMDNQTQYMDGKQALTATLIANGGNTKQMVVVTIAKAHFPSDIAPCDTKPYLAACQPFQFVLMYTNNINTFPTHLSQFQAMVGEFHVKS